MRLLLKAALNSRRHLSLAIVTLATFLLLTLSSQLEMFALGIITRTGALSVGGQAPPSDRETNPLQSIIAKVQGALDLENRGIEAIIIVLVAVAILKGAALFGSRFSTQLLSIRISRDLRQRYFEHLQKLPMPFYHKYNIGTLASRVAGDASQIANSITSFITNYCQTPFTIVTTLGICFFVSWKLSLVIFIGLPLVIVPILLLTRKVKQITRQLNRNQERFSSVLIDFLAGIQTVKIFAMEPFSLKKYQEQNDQMAQLETKTAKYDLLTRPILHMITTVCLSTVLIFGLYVLHMPFSDLIVFCGLLHLFYEPVKKFAEENSNVQKGVVASERLFEVLHLDPDQLDPDGDLPLTTFNESIRFDQVWFRYADEWILKDVSFTVRKGETVALVGSTGAGKSTIVQLLPRLYHVEQGKILIDEIPIEKYTRSSLREQIAYVSQKPFLFYDTIAANLAYGLPYTREEIVDAAKRAHADEFISRLPDGYDAQLAEMGQNFSGGQCQRLAIARALVKKAPILILDEATSSLDAISEQKIKQAIMELHGQVTQIIIAHRLSTIEHADRIIFLEHGEKIAEGTRDELFEICPPFRLMWETHFQSSKTLFPSQTI